MMKIAVTDANIFIDLINLQMLAHLFELAIEIITSQEIVDQLNDMQFKALIPFIEARHLKVHLFTSDQFQEITRLDAPRSLDFADKSLAWLAVHLEAAVLTGDGPLRKFCLSRNLDVKGLVWLFDVWVENEHIAPTYAAEKMQFLISYNSRMPKDICEERIRKWRYGI